MSGRSVNLTTLFLGRLRPPKRLTSTSCTNFRQLLTTALLESAERESSMWLDKVSNPGPLTYESGVLPFALLGAATLIRRSINVECQLGHYKHTYRGTHTLT